MGCEEFRGISPQFKNTIRCFWLAKKLMYAPWHLRGSPQFTVLCAEFWSSGGVGTVAAGWFGGGEGPKGEFMI